VAQARSWLSVLANRAPCTSWSFARVDAEQAIKVRLGGERFGKHFARAPDAGSIRGTMKHWTKIVLLPALTSAALYYGMACGPVDKPVDPALADVILEGGASTKALEALVAATPKDDPEKGVEIDSPAADVELPPTPIATFKWHQRGATAARERPALGPLELVTLAAGASREQPLRSGWSPSAALAEFTGPLRELLGPERAAHAEAAMDGAGYFLVFSTDTEPDILRVFTTKTSYTPDAKAWDKLYAVNTWTTLSILSASFTTDSLSPNAGPFKGASIQFCIERL
jgi:hypothetical protein